MKKKEEYLNFENNQIPDGFLPNVDYLDKLESSVIKQLEIERIFENTKDGFSASSAYFESLENTVFEAVSTDDTQKTIKATKVVFLLRNKYVWMTAASIAAIFILGIFITNNNVEKDIGFSSLTLESEKWYLEQQEYFFTDDDLDYLLANKVYDIEIEDKEVQGELEDYLLKNDINPIRLYE